MAEPKKIYTREELTTCGYVFAACNLCRRRSLETVEKLYPEDHEADCPLADPDVVGVDVVVRTVPREDICGDCPASGGSYCVVPDWSLESHERLRELCSRYAVEDV